jgi:hypothetical protein
VSTGPGTDTGPEPAPAPHDPDVHVWEGTGLEEGNGKVPRWYLLVVAILAVFFVAYLAQYLVDAQPSSARMR